MGEEYQPPSSGYDRVERQKPKVRGIAKPEAPKATPKSENTEKIASVEAKITQLTEELETIGNRFCNGENDYRESPFAETSNRGKRFGRGKTLTESSSTSTRAEKLSSADGLAEWIFSPITTGRMLELRTPRSYQS